MEGELVWEVFQDVYAPGIIPPFLELEAYCRMSHTVLKPWEARAVRALAFVCMDVQDKKITADASKPKEPVVTGVPPGKKLRLISMNDTDGLKALFSKLGAKPPKPKTNSADAK